MAEDFVPASQAYIEIIISHCGDLHVKKQNRAHVLLECDVFLKLDRKFVKFE